MGTTGAAAGVDCPAGFYCPAGTGNYQLAPCPLGRFAAGTGNRKSEDCTICTEKFYCPEQGMQAGNTFKCGDGYMCDAGSESITGSRICKQDHFCKEGVETKCDPGTLSLVSGISAKEECVECAPGKICPDNSVGIIDCTAGRYCPGKHDSLTHADIKDCTAGHYCPTGSKTELKCLPGTF